MRSQGITVRIFHIYVNKHEVVCPLLCNRECLCHLPENVMKLTITVTGLKSRSKKGKCGIHTDIKDIQWQPKTCQSNKTTWLSHPSSCSVQYVDIATLNDVTSHVCYIHKHYQNMAPIQCKRNTYPTYKCQIIEILQVYQKPDVETEHNEIRPVHLVNAAAHKPIKTNSYCVLALYAN